MNTLTKYILGFLLSVLLTIAAFALVLGQDSFGVVPREILVALLVLLALVQLCVQLVLFLHLGEETKPRWNLTVFIFALIVVGVLVGGTLWIMNNLSHGQMQQEKNMFIEENIPPRQ